MPQYTNTPVFITEGKALYVPRISGLDKYGRHALTIIPNDQSIITDIESLYNDLIDWLVEKNNIDSNTRKQPQPWREVPSDKGYYSLGFTWSNKDMEEGYVFCCDENEAPFNETYKDQSLMGATFKVSFQLRPYCFTPASTNQQVYGVKLKPRKIKLIELAGLDSLNPPDSKELVGAEF